MKTELLLSLLWVGLCVSAAPEISPAQSSNCSEGWTLYQRRCFGTINLKTSWTNAMGLCQSLGAHLASVHNLWEYIFMQQLAKRAGLSTAWIGAYYFQGFWRWDDGSPFTYNNWYAQKYSPSNPCAYLNSEDSKGWTSAECYRDHPVMCSYQLSSC
ncbi:rheacalcin-2-like [Pholidichthys leucotaenia]